MIKPEIQKIVVGPIQTNCYIVKCPLTGKVLVIDPGDDSKKILRKLNRIDCIVYTHGHFDHIGAASDLIDLYKTVSCIHSLDLGMMKSAAKHAFEWGFKIKQPPDVTKQLKDGDTILVGALSFKVLLTPGHSPGSICLFGHGIAFTGDTLFAGSIGRTDFPTSSEKDMFNSLSKILSNLAKECIIYPGHGPSSTMHKEIASNPFLVSL